MRMHAKDFFMQPVHGGPDGLAVVSEGADA